MIAGGYGSKFRYGIINIKQKRHAFIIKVSGAGDNLSCALIDQALRPVFRSLFTC